jgi:hypothetical protein
MWQVFSSPRSTQLSIVIFMLWLLVSFAFGQTTNYVQRLLLNKPVERQIKGGETQIFQFDVKAGFYARAEVEQKNIDGFMLLFVPDGKLIKRDD